MLDSKKRKSNWAWQAANNNPHRRHRGKRLRYVTYAGILIFGVAAGGFLRFADTVAGLQPPATPKADAIVVLTGGYLRIDQAVSLLESGAGKRLLISGVHPDTSAEQIRKLTRAPETLFNCCVDIGREALDTIGNAHETASWVHEHGYSTILVVTNNYHMPRSLLELSSVDPQTQYLAYPVVNSDLKTANWMTRPATVKAMLSEYAKLTLATFRGYLSVPRTSGLRDETSQTGQ